MLAIFVRFWYTMRMSYQSAYEKSAAFYNAHPKAKACLPLINYGITGVFALAYPALFISACFLFEHKDVLKIFLVPAVALVIVSLLRMLIRRPRPYSERGAGIQPLLTRKGKDDDSFPSRHLACALSISILFLAYLPWAGILLIVLSALLGYIRFALGLHYPTDLLGGAALGGLCGLLLLI